MPDKMRTYRFVYFCKRVGVNTLQCVRLPYTDVRVLEFSKMYAKIGFETTAMFPYMPRLAEEEHHIKMRFRAWHRDIVIENPDSEKRLS